jgi:hypothetical protein
LVITCLYSVFFGIAASAKLPEPLFQIFFDAAKKIGRFIAGEIIGGGRSKECFAVASSFLVFFCKNFLFLLSLFSFLLRFFFYPFLSL